MPGVRIRTNSVPGTVVVFSQNSFIRVSACKVKIIEGVEMTRVFFIKFIYSYIMLSCYHSPAEGT